MANIAITTYCNLKCPYCFAEDIKATHEYIDLQQYKMILEWLTSSSNMPIGIIGGEPTLHPQFEEILNLTAFKCIANHTYFKLFTNGIHLMPYIDKLSVGTTLINLNNPKIMTDEQWSSILQTLEYANSKGLLNNDLCYLTNGNGIKIGCNIYPDEYEYAYIWDIVSKYNIHNIRVSVVSPGGIYIGLRNDKESYYHAMKLIFLNFCKNALKYNVQLHIDCNRIPLCYFNSEEINIIKSVCPEYNNIVCRPVVDITPDFRATACFGAYDPVDCSQFDSICDLERYLLHKKNYPLVQANCAGKCASCKQHELLTCQGGCLGFAQL